MKTLNLLIVVVLCLVSVTAFAGGIVTNTNQSAQYTRTLNRNASTDLDAVYYNPAGLSRLDDGLYLHVSNQMIWQTKTVINNLPTLNNDEFVGDVFAPLFPNLYFAYKSGKIAISGGFEPIGGGGSAVYEDGLPSFEMPVSGLVPQLGVQGYKLDTEFEGSSVYYSGQAGLTYKLSDMISLAVGGRVVVAKNTYDGYLKDIMVTEDGVNWIEPEQSTTALTLINTASNLQSFIDGGAGGLTLSQLQAAGQLTAEQVSSLEGGLQQLGIDPTGYTVEQVQASYSGVYSNLVNKTADVEVDAAQDATGFSPIFSVFVTPFEGLDIALRYEMKTELTLENDTEVDGSGMFADGVETHADIPAILAMGVAYQVMPKLRADANFNYYFNEGVNWDGKEEKIDNGIEFGVAFEYDLSDKLLISAGYSYGDQNVTPEYQTDLSYSLPSSTLAGGFGYKVSPKLMVNAGILNTFYDEDEKTTETYTETYKKTTFNVGVGFDYSF
ncbi:OmpP1/FadL family transporter [Fidelibacter multiformis]|uniref:OmpP1/FadL family transporter n=1 Tax=Fidelibacter multiformis TaxID=3377529 RepID=UPI0037DC80E6